MNCCKKTYRNEEDKKRLLNRLSRIEGQIRGIRKMVEEDAYCIDILTQSSAASSAVTAFSREIAEGHIRGCVTRGVRDGDDAVINELIETLGRLIK